LIKIVKGHFPDHNKLSDAVIEVAVDKFIEVRKNGVKRKDGKKPSTSELKDLMTAIYNYGQKDVLDIITDIGQNLPWLGILLKSKEDQKYYQDQSREDNDE
jgi:hypothetical protein